MKYIAHRGLFTGPNPELENRIDQLESALAAGFDVEIDLRWHEGMWWLGHDEPAYPISPGWLAKNKEKLWIHCKNIAALDMLCNTSHMYFYHDQDDVTITSNGKFWTYPGKELTRNSIMLMPEWQDPTLQNTFNVHCIGICSDWIEKIRDTRENSVDLHNFII
jgi:hypothetical protein